MVESDHGRTWKRKIVGTREHGRGAYAQSSEFFLSILLFPSYLFCGLLQTFGQPVAPQLIPIGKGVSLFPEVFKPHLNLIKAQLIAYHIQLGFNGKDHLRKAMPPFCSGVNLVCVDSISFVLQIGNVIYGVSKDMGQIEGCWWASPVGSHIIYDLHLLGRDPSILFHACLEIDYHPPWRRTAGEYFFSGQGNLYGPQRNHWEICSDKFKWEYAYLAPEGTSHICLMDPHPAYGYIQELCQPEPLMLIAHVGEPDIQFSGGQVVRHRHMGFHCHMGGRRYLKPVLSYVLCLFESLLNVPILY